MDWIESVTYAGLVVIAVLVVLIAVIGIRGWLHARSHDTGPDG